MPEPSPWYTEEEEYDEDLEGDELGAESDIPEDIRNSSWVLEQGVIYNQTLYEVIRGGSYIHEQVSKTGIRKWPLGLKSSLESTRKRMKTSKQTVYMHCSNHGLMIILRDPTIKKILTTFEKKSAEAMKGTGDSVEDRELMRAIEEKAEGVKFNNEISGNTSVAMFKEITGILSSLSNALGMYDIRLYCYLLMLSLGTVKLPPNTKQLFGEELKHFWKIARDRLVVLERRTQNA